MYLPLVRFWLRYNDDFLVIWGGTMKELQEFICKLNANDRNIKITFTWDFERISFLDLSISFHIGKLETRTFRKETAANTLLLASSHHPPSLIQGIPIGQFLRIRRNCSADADYQPKMKELHQRFRNRGYTHRTIRHARKRARASKRDDLISTHIMKPALSQAPPVCIITRY